MRSLVVLLCLVAAARPATSQDRPSAGLVDIVQTAIVQHTDDLLQLRQIDIAAGDLQTAHGQFDPVLNSSFDRGRAYQPLLSAQQPPGTLAAISNTADYSLSLQKQFATGLSFQPNLSMSRTDVDLTPPAYGRGTIAFDAIQPLMQGRGTNAVKANERAASRSLDSAKLNYRFTAASVALRATLAYWDYVAAAKLVAVATESEALSKRWLGEMQELVKADQRPATDLKQLQADAANRAAQRVSSEQQLFAARYNLGLAAGLSLDQIAALPMPADDFPAAPASAAAAALNPVMLTTLAMGRRADVAAAQTQELAAQELITAARDSTRARLDLSASLVFTGLKEGDKFSGYVTPLFKQIEGGNFLFSVNYRFPLLNNAALGQLAKAEATREQAALQTAETTRTAGGNVIVAADAVRRAIELVGISDEAARLFASAVDDERAKMQIGLSTVLDLVLTEDRLTQSQVDAINARAGYARAVAQLRFETGTILLDSPEPRVDISTLVTLPPS